MDLRVELLEGWREETTDDNAGQYEVLCDMRGVSSGRSCAWPSAITAETCNSFHPISNGHCLSGICPSIAALAPDRPALLPLLPHSSVSPYLERVSFATALPTHILVSLLEAPPATLATRSWRSSPLSSSSCLVKSALDLEVSSCALTLAIVDDDDGVGG